MTEIPSVREFRRRVHDLMATEAASKRRRDVVILAIDGIPHALAEQVWEEASLERMRSVVPTTSSTAWLSSVTGLPVAAHGVPGVVFRLHPEADAVINAFTFCGDLEAPAVENLFSDAARIGYTPLALLGDLSHVRCAWRDLLIRHAAQEEGARTFSLSPPLPAPALLARQVGAAVTERTGTGRPHLLWYFIEVDAYVHRCGYDAFVVDFLRAVGDQAGRLADAGYVVVAYSDHGLTPTCHDPEVAAELEQTSRDHCCHYGGAGRMRWAYCRPETRDALRQDLADRLSHRATIVDADDLFTPGSLARQRVGDLVLIATGERFVTEPGYRYDHGSRTRAELEVPLAVWGL